jgi:hypothetical protein
LVWRIGANFFGEVWTGGNLAWKKAAKDFDWERTTALPKLESIKNWVLARKNHAL